MVSRVVSRRDMATQMSPESSTNSSPRGKSSFSPAVRSVAELQNDHPAKLEVREVQIDKGSTTISWSKRHRSRRIKSGFPDVDEFYQNVTGTCAPSLDLSEVAASISKYAMFIFFILFKRNTTSEIILFIAKLACLLNS